jgi:altronate hydrolase
MQYIKIHSLDNVAVALADIAEGTELWLTVMRSLRQDMVRGHKFALRPSEGENVVKYGLPIGHALADIARVNIFILTIRAPI